MNLRSILRPIKRSLLSRGYSAPAHIFLEELKVGISTSFHPVDGSFLVNLSFDLELGLNSPFWERGSVEALHLGKLSKNNLLPTLSFLGEKEVPCNVQIVCGLLDYNFITSSFLSDDQRNLITKHDDLFQFSQDEHTALSGKNVEVGILGFSHRRFSTLSQKEAQKEITKSVELITDTFGRSPRFMSFPKNNIQYSRLLSAAGINAWRGNRQGVYSPGEVPVGLWFAPGNISPHDLTRILKEIRELHPQGFFLHLWGHFTEMNRNTLADMVTVIRDGGFSFTTISNYIES